ncbi:MAG: BON domain-containing protein [Rhodopirellula sp. JB044]|uniref:BON domain-containing protein n=1 Tax=Rhodopirellula sp. JB044 TaxID=3342844 RepID=UPI00370AA11F
MNFLVEHSGPSNESAVAANHRYVRIIRKVRDELARRQRSGLSRVRCEYQRGILHLLGEVDAYYLKQLAQESARRVEGVTHIVNSIHVMDPTPPNRKLK